MPVVMYVAIGGALGSAARHYAFVLSKQLLGTNFPWHTLLVNMVGCFIMGAITEVMALRYQVSLELRSFLTAGFLGGFTTFSAFSLDFALLVERKAYLYAGVYAAASLVLSIAAVFAGLQLMRAVLQ